MTFTFPDYFIISVIVFTLAVDFWLARKGEGSTISYRIALWSRQWPIIPLLAGILMGHLWFPNRGYMDCSLCK